MAKQVLKQAVKVRRPDWARRLEAARRMKYDNAIDFARVLGLSQQRYSHYENGVREPDIMIWNLIRKELGVSVDFIMGGDQSAPRAPASAENSKRPRGN